MRRGDMPIGEIQRANSSNTCSHDTLPSRTRANSSGCVSSAQMQPAIALRGSFCPPEIVSLMLWRTFSSGMPPWIITLSSEWFGAFAHDGQHVVDRRIDAGGRRMAARLDLAASPA